MTWLAWSVPSASTRSRASGSSTAASWCWSTARAGSPRGGRTSSWTPAGCWLLFASSSAEKSQGSKRRACVLESSPRSNAAGAGSTTTWRMAMRLGVLVPTRGVVMQSARRPPVDECWTMARLAHNAGYDAVWVGDSIVAKPRLEPMTTLAYLAGITTRVRLGTAVLLPALRHPVVLAHQIANVDQISRGRVVLGLGVGWSLPSAEREWAACGADHKRRVRRLEEHVQIWRMLWRGEPVTHRDGDVELTDHTIGPLPWHPAGPPVLITAANRGEMLAAQFDRFGRLGDGIITTYVHAEEGRLRRERPAESPGGTPPPG